MMTRRLLSLLLGNLLCACAVVVHAQGLRLPGPAAVVPEASVGKAQRAADYIVAVVNSEPITNHQVRLEMQRLVRQSSQALPDAREVAAVALERLINERAQLQLARESGIKVDDAAVDEAEQNVARQNQLELGEIHRRLAADGIDRRQFRNQLRDQLILVRLREREINQKVRVSEREIDQYLRDLQRNPSLDAQDINISHVLFALSEDASAAQLAAAQAKAQRVMERARAGEDFSSLARELSDAKDGAAGGQLGMRPVERYPSLFVDATRNSAVGGVVTVRSGAGIHVLKLTEKQAKGAPASAVEQTLASHILLRVTPQMSESAAQEKLAGMRARIIAGQADFATLAKDNSQDGSAAQGGELGWVGAGQFVPEFEQAMNALEPGQISAQLVSRFGVHLITVTQRRVVPLSQREQREAVRNVLREKKSDDAVAVWAQDLRARAYVELREPPG